MMRLFLVLPGLLGDESSSILRDPTAYLKSLASQGEIARIEPGWTLASALGLDPAFQLSPGPLAVAAFGVDPPVRSVQFQVSLCSVDSGTASMVDEPLPAEVADHIGRALARLDTRDLKFIAGYDRQHALVWESGSLDLHTTAPSGLPLPLTRALPVGDGEPHLRRFIDDSVNLLSDLEFNQRRVDEGRQPVNCAWPWGQGFRQAIPNLALTYGFPVQVQSGSLHFAGLSRLAGANHGDWKSFDRGTATPLSRLVQPCPLLVASIGAFARFRRDGCLDELGWLLRELDDVVLRAWVDRDDAVEILMVALGDGNGLSLRWSKDMQSESWLPFDERALDEPLPKLHLHEAVRQFASGSN